MTESSSSIARKGHGLRRVYSYLRFSTPIQMLGDSARRQMQAAADFAKQHGYVFDSQLRDEGLSAWSGKNRTKGALGRFLGAVEKGVIPPGSILFVEELDRLSREGMVDALETILFGLIKRDITIATPNGIYDRASVNSGGIWRLIAKLEVAHDESQKKSVRLGSVWAERKKLARTEGAIVTSRCPHWLKLVDGRFEKIPEAVLTVKMIFEHAGPLGRSRLVKKLNAEAPWRPAGRRKGSQGNGWRMSYVRKILTNRAVLGEYQPYTKRGANKRVPDGEPILKYFPQIIDEEIFNATQQRLRMNKTLKIAGRTGLCWNLFTYTAKCAYCGGPMKFRDRGPRPKGGQYLTCDRADRGFGCKLNSVRYDEFQNVILNNCADIRPDQILPNENDAAKRRKNLRIQIAGIEEELKTNADKRSALLEQAEHAQSDKMRTLLNGRFEELLAKQGQLEDRLSAVRESLNVEETDKSALANWKKDLNVLRRSIAPQKAIELRLRLRSHLFDFISKIEVFGRGFEKRYDPAEIDPPLVAAKVDTYAEYVEAVVEEYDLNVSSKRDFRIFLDEIMKRRMSKNGRFYRIHFRTSTGSSVDVVPMGSLASGFKLLDREGERWSSINPDWTELWKEHIAQVTRMRNRLRGKSRKGS